MANKKTFYVCSNCGEKSPKWMGKCSACGEWNTFLEESLEKNTNAKKQSINATTLHLSQVSDVQSTRISSGNKEFDTVCGGGIVKGAVILIGGEPGIGKSTLALQIAGHLNCLYVSGEETPGQIKQRADRLNIDTSKVLISTNRYVEEIEVLIEKEKPQCVIIDSIQTILSSSIQASCGSVSQVRESATLLTDIAKRLEIPLLLIGHITKEGNIAGPKILEHIVDTVLYFEGDWSKDYRLLRSFKNRFGSVNEIGLFRMSEKGLEIIEDKNELFLNPYQSSSPGCAVCTGIEGSRTLLFEAQSLVTATAFTNPRRMADGFDPNRLTIIAAVLEKYAHIQLSSSDIFINTAGGFQIKETSADLAIAAAIISSYRSLPIDPKIGFIGEIALSGDIRPVVHLDRRIAEFERNGFLKVVVSKREEKELKSDKMEIVSINNISMLSNFIS